MYEVFWNSENRCLLVEDYLTKRAMPFDDMPMSWKIRCDEAVKCQYPGAHEKLCELYGNGTEFAHGRMKQFIACNFSDKDGIPDIDEDFNFNIEKTACPARDKICKHCICCPAISNEISEREKQILSFFVLGLSEEEIAESLFISPFTVRNHIRNMYRKVGVAGKSNPDRRLIAFVHAKRIII